MQENRGNPEGVRLVEAVSLAALVLFLALPARPAYGAGSVEVRFGEVPPALAPASTFAVEVLLDAAEPVNTVDLEVGYAANLLTFRGARTGDSIVTFWRETPVARDGTIAFRGGFLTPFSGEGGKVATLVFEARAEGTATLSFPVAKVYLADGQGTEAIARTVPATLSFVAGAPRGELAPFSDATPPILVTEVVRDPVLGNLLLAFRAEDRESGVREVSACMMRWFTWDEWRAAENPVAVPWGVWQVVLRAVSDGGETTEVLTLPVELVRRVGALLLGIIAAVVAARVFYNRRCENPGG